MAEIKIGNSLIGENHPCFTIAEAGANHDGNIEKAFRLIDAAKEANADSIKFQTYKASKLTTKTAPKYWDDGKKNETQYDVFSKLDTLTKDNWEEIFDYAKKKQLMCFSTPFDSESVDLLYSVDVPAFKIASADITNFPLIQYIASKKLPIFISTGMASEVEISEAINLIEDLGNHVIIIMHCITAYPTKPEDANLKMIQTLSKNFSEYVIGYSDHTIGTIVPVCSTFYGAKCIEKHFTYDKQLTTSPDHRLSLNIEGFQKLVNELKISEISRGSNLRTEFNAETEAVKFARRSIVSKFDIPKGTKITENMIDVKRPGTGISPKYFFKIIGSKTLKNIQEDSTIQWDDIDFSQ